MARHWDFDDNWLATVLWTWKIAEQNAGSEYLTLRLFQNDFEPQPGLLLTDLVEASYPGYTRQSVQWAEWQIPVVVDHVASIETLNFHSFTAGASGFSSQTIYGYYITHVNGVYRWAESFEEPQVMRPAGELKVKPRISLATYPNPIPEEPPPEERAPRSSGVILIP